MKKIALLVQKQKRTAVQTLAKSSIDPMVACSADFNSRTPPRIPRIPIFTGQGNSAHGRFLKAILTRLAAACILLIGHANGILADGLQYERFRLRPKVSIYEGYSDNVYLAEEDPVEDFHTEIAPELALDVALMPGNYFTFAYRGNFYFHNTADNFDSEQHSGEIAWNLESAKGSTASAGVNLAERSAQPYSPMDSAREYTLLNIHGDVLWMAGDSLALGTDLEISARRFESAQFRVDDYNRQQFGIEAVNNRFPIFPFLLRYRFVLQDNTNLEGLNRDFRTHAIYTGARWLSSRRFSGSARVGYLWSNFESPALEDFSGLATDIDLTYHFSEITQFSLTGLRDIQPTTIAERDTGYYFVLTRLGLKITYQFTEKILTEMHGAFIHKKFETDTTFDREDEGIIAGLRIQYNWRRWLAVSIAYQHHQNNSDLPTVDYRENSAEAGVRISI